MFLHSLKVLLLLLLWVGLGCVLLFLSVCMLLGQVARFNVTGVECVWDAMVWDSGNGPWGNPARQVRGQGLAGGRMSDGEGRCTELVGTGGSVTFISTQCSGISSREPWGSSNHLCNSCQSTLCKEFYYFVHFIKKKKSCSFKQFMLLAGSSLPQVAAAWHGQCPAAPGGSWAGAAEGVGAGGGCSNRLLATPCSARCYTCQGVGDFSGKGKGIGRTE